MPNRYLQIATTPSVAAERDRYGSAAQYARLSGAASPSDPVGHDRLGPDEAAFISRRDGFYVASVSETGWPYVQFRGGPPGFLRVLDERTLGWADLRGNRQHITTGNVAADDRVSLFLMDYANRRRLKIFGRMSVVHAADDPAPAARLAVPGHPGHVERAAFVAVEAFDWNCPQHITPRFTEDELAAALQPLAARLRALEAENETLRRERPGRRGAADPQGEAATDGERPAPGAPDPQREAATDGERPAPGAADPQREAATDGERPAPGAADPQGEAATDGKNSET